MHEIQKIKELAESGDADAQFELALRYVEGAFFTQGNR